MTSYTQNKIGFDGLSQTLDWSGGQYDDRGRLTHYQQSTTDDEGNTSKTIWDAQSYDAHDQVSSYKQMSWDARGNMSQLEQDNETYDTHGRALSYTQIQTDPNGNATTTAWSTDASGYDVHGNLLHYTQTATDAFGNATLKNWSDGVYDQYGRVLSYNESDTDPRGATSSKIWSDASYDPLGHVTAYKEFDTDPDGNTASTDWSHGQYNAQGNLLGYQDISTDMYGETSIKTWSAQSSDYDRYGDLLGYTQRVTSSDGTVTDTQRTDGAYDVLGQITNYQEDVITSAPGQPVPDLDTRWDVSVDEKTLVDGTDTTEEHHVWSGGVYDSLGHLSAYQETVTDVNSGAIQLHVWQGTYDPLGDLTQTHEALTDPSGLVTRTDWSGFAFDSRGRATASRQTVTTSDEPGIVVLTLTSGRAFDRYGQASAGEESVLTAGTSVDGHSIGVTTTDDISAATFSNGALTGYRQSTHTTGTDQNLTWLNVHTETTFAQMTRTSYVQSTTDFDPTTGAPGNTVTDTRTGIVRDASERVIAYTDSVNDPTQGPTPTVTQRLMTRFGAFGKLSGWAELITTPQGDTQFAVTTDVQQDARGNIISFSETTREYKTGSYTLPSDWDSMTATDQSAFMSQLQSSLSANTKLTLDAASSQVNAEMLSVTNKTRVSSAYDLMGRLVASTDDIQSTDDPQASRETWTASEFDSGNRVSADDKVVEKFATNAGFTGDPVETDDTTRWLMTYNSVGQIGGYDERVTNSTTPDVVTQHQVSGITYDTWGQIATSVDIEIDGKPGADSTTVLNGAMTTVTDQSNAVFDTLGRLVGYEEVIHRYGQSEDGYFLYDYEKHVRTAKTYDADHPDLVLSTTEDVTNSDAPGLLTVVEHDNHSFGLNDQPTDYTETTHRSGIGLDTVDTVHRSGIVTDTQGRLLRYTEQTTSSARPTEVQNIQWSGSYDDRNRLTASQQTTSILVNGIEIEEDSENKTNITYNDQNQMTAYDDVSGKRVTEADGNWSPELVSDDFRRNMQYNSLGQLTSYDATQSRSDSPTVDTVEFRNGVYDRAGRLVGDDQTTHTLSTDASGLSLDLTTMTDRFSTSFDELGETLGYTEQSMSSDKPDVVVITTASDIQYNAQGLTVASVIDALSQSSSGGSDALNVHHVTTLSDAQYDDRGRMTGKTEVLQTFGSGLNTTDTTVTQGQVYDAWGNVVARTTQEQSSVTPDVVVKTDYRTLSADAFGRATSTFQQSDTDGLIETKEQDNILRNALNQTIGYTETDTSSALAQTTQTVWSGDYDDKGRLLDDSKTESDDKTDVVLTTSRHAIQYDGDGNTDKYDETDLSSATPDLSSTLSWSSQGYNGAGQLKGFAQTKITSGTGYQVVETTDQDGMNYLSSGQLDGYVSRTTSSLAPLVTQVDTRISTTYDTHGREDQFVESNRSLASDGSLDVTTWTQQTDASYNDDNQLIGRSQVVRSDASPNLTTRTDWSGSYNALGELSSTSETDRMLGIDETHNAYDLTTTSTDNKTYDSFERVIGETGESTNGQGQTTDRTFSVSGFNAQGLALGDDETTRTTGVGLNITNTNLRTNLSYDDQGRLSNDDSEQTSSATPGLVSLTTDDHTAYNQDGQVETESSHNETLDTATNGAGLHTVEDTEKTTSYDNKGRMSGYSETDNDDTLGLVTTTEQSDTTYNVLGLQNGFDQSMEKQSVTSGGLDITTRRSHQVAMFNKLGQEFQSIDTAWSSDAPDKTDHTSTVAMTYNAAGQLEAYRRATQSISDTDPSSYYIRTTETRSDTGYDAAGRVISTNGQTTSSAAAAVINTVNDIFSYNDFGQETDSGEDSHETTADGRLDIENRSTTQTTYDATGQSVREHGTSWSSQAPGMNTETDTVIAHGDGGLVSDNKTTTTMTGSSAVMDTAQAQSLLSDASFDALTDDQRASLLESLTSGAAITMSFDDEKNNFVYDASGQTLSYLETSHGMDADGIEKTDLKSDITYNGLGQETNYDLDEKQSSDVIGSALSTETLTQRRNETYNVNGQLNSYTEHATDNSSLVHDLSRVSTTYNDLGFVSSKYEETHEYGTSAGGSIDIHATLRQSNMGYDTEGRLNSYQEDSTSSANGPSTDFWSASAFDAFGHASTTHETGQNTKDGSWQSDTSILATDIRGHALLSHSKGYTSVAGENDTWTTAINDFGEIGFNALGQSTYQEEWGLKHGTGNFVSVTDNSFADSYDSLGRAEHTRETLTQQIPTDTGSQSQTTITETDTQDYDAFNQVVKKTGHLIQIADGENTLNSDTTWTGSYDNEGRASGFDNQEDTRILDATGALLATQINDTGRTDITYNNQGQPSSYNDFTTQQSYDLNGTLVEQTSDTSTKQNLQYNQDAQLIHMDTVNGMKNGESYSSVYDVTAFSFDGDATQWTRTDKSGSAAPVTTTQDDGVFDDLGRAVRFDQQGVANGEPFTKSDSDIRYDARGNMISMTETGETDAGVYSNTQTMSYDIYGRLSGQTEIDTKADVVTNTTNTSGYVYNVDGQLTNKHSDSTDAFGQVTSSDGVNTYDGQGRLVETVETNNVVDKDGHPVSNGTVTTDSVFDADGYLTQATTTNTTKNAKDQSVDTTTSVRSNTYDKSTGLITADDVSSVDTTTDASGQVTTNTSDEKRSDIVRYTTDDAKQNPEHRAGRIASYDDETQTDKEKPQYAVVDGINYNADGSEKDSLRATVSGTVLQTLVSGAESIASAAFNLIRAMASALTGGLASLLQSRPDMMVAIPDGESIAKEIPNAQSLLTPNDLTFDVVQRSNATQDAQGRAISWTETSRSSSAPKKVSTSDVNVSYSGSTSELSTYHAVNSELTDVGDSVNTIDLHDYQYEAGRVVSVKGDVHETAVDIRTGEMVTDHTYSYQDFTDKVNDQGQATDTRRITTNDSDAPELVRTDTTSGIQYNDDGSIRSQLITSNETGPGLDKNYDDLQTMAYDSVGRLISTTNVRTDIAADGTRGDPSTDVVDNSDFDAYGRATTVTTTQSGGGLTAPEITTDQITAFDANGQEASAVRTIGKVAGGSGNENLKQNLTFAYDKSGRLISTSGSVTDVITDKTTGDVIQNRTYDTSSQTLAFNSLGQSTRTSSSTSNDSGSDLLVSSSQTKLTYDAAGHAIVSDAHNKTLGRDGSRREYDSTRTATAWDADGNPTDFTDVVTNDTNAPAAIVRTETTGGVYVNGQLMNWNEKDQTNGTNPDGTAITGNVTEKQEFNAVDLYGRVHFDHEIDLTQVSEWDQTAQQDSSQATDYQSQIDAINAQLPATPADDPTYKTTTTQLSADETAEQAPVLTLQNQLNQDQANFQLMQQVVQSGLLSILLTQAPAPARGQPYVTQKQQDASNWDKLQAAVQNQFHFQLSSDMKKQLTSAVGAAYATWTSGHSVINPDSKLVSSRFTSMVNTIMNNQSSSLSSRQDTINSQMTAIKTKYDTLQSNAAAERDTRLGPLQQKLSTLGVLLAQATADHDHAVDASARAQQNGATSSAANATYDINGRMTGEDTWDADDGKITHETDRQYDQFGRLVGYSATQMNIGNTAVEKINDVSLTYSGGQVAVTTTKTTDVWDDGTQHVSNSVDRILLRDAMGRTTLDERTSNDSSTPAKTDIVQVASSYDNKNRVAETVTTTSEKIGDAINLVSKETQDVLSYDALGRINEFKTSTTDGADDLVKTSTGKNIYGKDGLLTGTDSNDATVGAVLNTSVHVLSVTTATENGRPTEQTVFTDQDSSRVGVATLQKIHIDYAGNTVTTTTDQTEWDPNTQTHTSTSQQIDTLDDTGRATARTTVASNDSVQPDKTSTTKLANITYDQWGRMTGYNQYTEGTGQKPDDSVNQNITYNADGQQDTFVDTDKDVVYTVASSVYDTQGHLIHQAGEKTWGAGSGTALSSADLVTPTLNGNIDGLSGNWTQGSVSVDESYTYYADGRMATSDLSVHGTGTSKDFAGVPLAGTGGNGSANEIYLESTQTDMQYNGQGQMSHYNYSTTQYGITTENYLSSSRHTDGSRKTKTRNVVRLDTTTGSNDTVSYNSLGQAAGISNIWSSTTGSSGNSNQSNIKYDNQGRMVSATTESYTRSVGSSNGKGYVADTWDKKDQTFTYDSLGIMTTNDVRTYYHNQNVTMAKSGNFFASKVGQVANVFVQTALALVPVAGPALAIAYSMAVAYSLGASPGQMWQTFAVSVGAAVVGGMVKGPTSIGASPATATVGSSFVASFKGAFVGVSMAAAASLPQVLIAATVATTAFSVLGGFVASKIGIKSQFGQFLVRTGIASFGAALGRPMDSSVKFSDRLQFAMSSAQSFPHRSSSDFLLS